MSLDDILNKHREETAPASAPTPKLTKSEEIARQIKLLFTDPMRFTPVDLSKLKAPKIPVTTYDPATGRPTRRRSAELDDKPIRTANPRDRLTVNAPLSKEMMRELAHSTLNAGPSDQCWVWTITTENARRMANVLQTMADHLRQHAAARDPLNWPYQPADTTPGGSDQ